MFQMVKIAELQNYVCRILEMNVFIRENGRIP